VPAFVKAQTKPAEAVYDFRGIALEDGSTLRAVEGFRSKNSELRLLVRSNLDSFHVVLFDLSAQHRSSAKLNVRPLSELFDIHPNGNTIICARSSPSGRTLPSAVLLETDRSGAVINSHAMPFIPVAMYVGLAGEMKVVDRSGNVRLVAPGGEADGIPMQSERTLLASPFADGDVAVVDAITGDVKVYGPSPEKPRHAWTIPSSVLQEPLSRIAPAVRARTLIINDIAITVGGHVLLNVSSGIRGSDGAMVLAANKDGTDIRTFRLGLPTDDRYRSGSNPEGFMGPAYIESTIGNKLLLADRSGRVAQYQLPLK